MTVSTAAITVVGVLCLANIALTLAVIRRLNEQGRLLAERGRAPAAAGYPPPLEVEPGARVGDFTVTAMDGEPVSRADLHGSTLMAFMAPGCQSCEHSLPEFVARAGSAPGGRDHVLAVVLGKGPGRDELCAELAPVARVLTEEEEGGPVIQAFGIGALPAFAVLAGDVMVASYALPERIPVPDDTPV
ncbi:TlpA family protein disulfide reductase [Actinomadura sp. 9N407]|uniref:TlpA family protein disulfide reductase n=1 Tax=Actinomadura sp. 9N407 TaxID=3375154 RepID=UPI00379DEBD0